MTNYKNHLENPDKEIVAWYIQKNQFIDDQLIKWSVDFCSANKEIVDLHLQDFNPYLEWLNESTTYSSLEEFNKLREIESDLFWKIYSEITNHFEKWFIEGIILVIIQLFDDDIIKSKF